MAAVTKPESTSTAVATTEKPSLPAHLEAIRLQRKEQNALVAAIRGTQWGRDTTPELARAVAHYCHESGLDPVRHVELLGGRIYLTAELYDEKGAHLIRAGVVIPDEPDYINADARLEKLAAAGDEWARAEQTRRLRERIRHSVPEKSLAAVVQRFRLAATGQAIVGVNWCGGNGRRDPVGDAEPAKTAATRARRRAWKQIADVIPQYAEIVRPLEGAAKVASHALPVSVVEPARPVRALAAAPADDPYGVVAPRVVEAPIPPAQFSDDPGLRAEEVEWQDDRDLVADALPIADARPARARRDALREG